MEKQVAQWFVGDGNHLQKKILTVIYDDPPPLWIRLLLLFKREHTYEYETMLGVKIRRFCKILFGKEYVSKQYPIPPDVMNCRCYIEPLRRDAEQSVAQDAGPQPAVE